MDLAKEISYLLYQHDCVILPNFGAFIKQPKPTEKNESVGYIKPASQTITFNNQIKNNDGLVANRLTITRGCSYAEALELVENAVSEFSQALMTRKNADILGVGTFYFTSEEKQIFVPHHSLNFSKESFGLPKLKLDKLELKSVSSNPPSKPILPGITKTNYQEEVDTPVLVQKKLENQRKYRELKEQKRNQRNTAVIAKRETKFSSLSIVNTLGSFVLIAIVVSLFIFEKNIQESNEANQQIASLLDIDNTTMEVIEEQDDHNLSEDLISFPETYDIYALTSGMEEAQELHKSIFTKYEHSKIAQDGSNSVLIISFDDPELAQEYKKLLQNKLDQKLVIK